MATIVRGTVPATEFALAHTLEACPDLEFEVERIVISGDDAAMPLLWVRGEERDRVEAAFEEDDSIREVSLVAGFDDDLLYRMEWVGGIRLVLQMITNSEATVLDAYGKDGKWSLRVMYPERDLFSKTHSFCEKHGIEFEIESIRDLEGEPAGRFGLTKDQYKTLRLAAEQGYFKIPREADQDDLAEELGISHQAVSERIRRGLESLIEDTLLVGPLEDDD